VIETSTIAPPAVSTEEEDRGFSIIPSQLLGLVRVTVIIPTLNEAANLPQVFEAMPFDVAELIVVDGRSTDGTPEVAQRLWPSAVVVTQRGKGKGDALAEGCRRATGDVVVLMDADGSTDPSEIPRFVAALLTGADFAKGSRNITGGGSEDITRLRNFGNRCLTWLVNVLCGVRYSDVNYGYNAVWRHHLPALNLDTPGFEVEALLSVRAARLGLKVLEVPSYESNRLYGRSNLHAYHDGMRVLRLILAERIRPC
jgi:glycosyltransferase involved in cell wall biosynthesis